jgi:hypothetical protein
MDAGQRMNESRRGLKDFPPLVAMRVRQSRQNAHPIAIPVRHVTTKLGEEAPLRCTTFAVQPEEKCRTSGVLLARALARDVRIAIRMDRRLLWLRVPAVSREASPS